MFAAVQEAGCWHMAAEGACAVCPELAIADISPQEADSRFV
jgi:hypothetical protein